MGRNEWGSVGACILCFVVLGVSTKLALMMMTNSTMTRGTRYQMYHILHRNLAANNIYLQHYLIPGFPSENYVGLTAACALIRTAVVRRRKELLWVWLAEPLSGGDSPPQFPFPRLGLFVFRRRSLDDRNTKKRTKRGFEHSSTTRVGRSNLDGRKIRSGGRPQNADDHPNLGEGELRN